MCIVMKNLFFLSWLFLVLVGCNSNASVEFFKDNGYQEDTVYISGISTESIKKRISGGIKPHWEKEKKSDK